MVALNPAYASSESIDAPQNRVGDFFCRSSDRVGVNRLSIQQPRLESELTFTITASGRPFFINADPIGFAGGMNWYAYANGNPIMYVDPSGNITILSGVIGGAIGAVAGAVGQFGVDVVNVAFNDGEFSSASTYAGAIAGGATTGAVLGTTFNPYLAGAAGGAVGNATTQAIDVATGKRDGFSGSELAFGTTVGAATGFIPGPKISPFNSGRNSFTAIAKSTQTKLANGTIQNVSLKTSAKIAFGQTFDKALFQGSLVGAAGGFVPGAFDQGSIFNSNLSSGLK